MLRIQDVVADLFFFFEGSGETLGPQLFSSFQSVAATLMPRIFKVGSRLFAES